MLFIKPPVDASDALIDIAEDRDLRLMLSGRTSLRNQRTLIKLAALLLATKMICLPVTPDGAAATEG